MVCLVVDVMGVLILLVVCIDVDVVDLIIFDCDLYDSEFIIGECISEGFFCIYVGIE